MPVAKILKQDIAIFAVPLGTAEQPFLPIIPIGQREIVTLARAVLASKIGKFSSMTQKLMPCLKRHCMCGSFR